MMTDLFHLLREIKKGRRLKFSELAELAELTGDEREAFIRAAGELRAHFFGTGIHLCAIVNAKSGACGENCSFCSQSVHHSAGAPEYDLIPAEAIEEMGLKYRGTPVHRFSPVTSGVGLSQEETGVVAAGLAHLPKAGIKTCASLGIIGEYEFKLLKDAGVTRYHHNLETARSHFTAICSSHQYEDRAATVRRAKHAGMQVCSGGIFGIGETMEQVAEFAHELMELGVTSVPLNFLVPHAGTPMADMHELTPERCLHIIALMRFALPDKDIYICGGRLHNLCPRHEEIFAAGASGIMTGDYLTATGQALAEDLAMIARLGLKPR